MPKLFEILGYPVADVSAEATRHRQQILCPFMGLDCDGGGNRYLSSVNLKGKGELQEFFRGRGEVPAGVCSIQVRTGEAPWIVCPRRLLTFRWGEGKTTPRQLATQREVLKLLGLPAGTLLGVWPEVKFQHQERVDGRLKLFDSTFDYILLPIGDVKDVDLEGAVGMPWRELRGRFRRGGYKIFRRNGTEIVRECPNGVPFVVEIMTSSTSGGDKKKRTTIPLAFEDAILGRAHEAPGINYRQVWARMVSQLVVKSEVALGWGGRAIWVVQDVLTNYIKSTTALDLDRLIASAVSEVNMLSFSYGNQFTQERGVIELVNGNLFAGPIAADPTSDRPRQPAFQDMIRAAVRPPLGALLMLLSRRRPAYRATVP